MRNDSFVLTMGQGQQLEFALRRNGWTAKDVQMLCEENMLTQVMLFVKAGRELPSQDALFAARFEPIEQVLSKEVWARHGFELSLRTRLFNGLKPLEEGYWGVKFLWQLVGFSRSQFMRQHRNVGEDLCDMVEEILKERGMCFGMSLPELSEEDKAALDI